MTSSTTVEILGGIAEIGYSMILVSTPNARVLLDMGMRATEESLLRWPADPRPGLELVDLLRGGVLRELPGFYDPDQLAHAPELASEPWAEADPRPTAIFLSHAHIDHEGALGFARPEIPLYATPGTVRVLAALSASGEPRMGRTPDPVALDPGTPLPIGDLTVEFRLVDHDVPGAAGVIVTTPDGTVAYSGDINFHRDGGSRSHSFAERIRGCELLVTETTGLSFDGPDREPRSEDEIDRIVAEALAVDALHLVALYPRDVERAERIIRLAASLGRTLVWPDRDAAFLRAMGIDQVAGRDAVTLDDVRANPASYLVQPDVRAIPSLADLPIEPGRTAWIHSQGEPLGPFMPDWAVFMEWLERLGIRVVEAGSSGHASGAALHAFVDAVAPARVIPIHGFRPERLQPSVPVALPAYGELYEL
ncbi:MBL fold metallo-hydrolase [Microbacterium indicum]|uniref:MBL fold metallo-hydrolase n=1 Tax=Microbacterium indicum TaxID=358100 RepID=UPI000405B5D3|nr:MBL fold metallo-hydrolase [Microbacterium indicum]